MVNELSKPALKKAGLMNVIIAVDAQQENTIMQVTDEMLVAAMKKAVETGILAKQVDEVTYLKYWNGMKQALQAALNAAGL
jgi:hypothetical protein